MYIQIFTDAGAFKKEKGFLAISSLRIFVDKELIKKEIIVLDNATVPYGEMYSIYRALELIQMYIEEKKTNDYTIHLYTDSLLCHNTLNVWIYSWIKNSKDGVLYNSSKNKVANQELILKAFKIKRKLKNIKIFHINSHVYENKLKMLYKKFMKFNKIEISFEDFSFIYLQNKLCDEPIKEKFKEIKNNYNKNNVIKLL